MSSQTNTPMSSQTNTPMSTPTNTPMSTPYKSNIYVDIYESKNGVFNLIDKWIKTKDNDTNSFYEFIGYFKSSNDNRNIHLDMENKWKPIITVTDNEKLSDCSLSLILAGNSPNPIGLIRDKHDFILTDLNTNTPFGKWSLIIMNQNYLYEPIVDLKKGYITYKISNLDNSDKNKRVLLPLIFKKDNNDYTILTIDKSNIEQNNDYICQQPLNSPSPSNTNLCYKVIKKIEYPGLGVMIRLSDTMYGLYHNITDTRPI
jgi:hypothetical protein